MNREEMMNKVQEMKTDQEITDEIFQLMAENLWAYFSSLVGQGFSREEALELVMNHSDNSSRGDSE